MACLPDAGLKASVRITGIVQGVGFRPFVARLAQRYCIAGFVKNDSGHVVIEAAGTERNVRWFLEDIVGNPPPGAQITGIEQRLEHVTQGAYDGYFIIDKSGVSDFTDAMISPDIAVCEDCLRELTTAGDPRFLNPFISCVSCGPRFSIIEALPYDRGNTAMRDFDMCPRCAGQYTDPSDRRCHAQTVSCNSCGPELSWRGRDLSVTGNAASLEAAVRVLRGGGIVAVKGIGGYHLACSPFENQPVERLRRLKGREQKPFAVMFLDMDSLREHAVVSDKELELLRSPARPIVLLGRKASRLDASVCRTSRFLGAFLPYTPLQYLLLRSVGPLVMTSANVSSLPIIKDDDDIYRFFGDNRELDGVLSHDRKILRRLDDAVAAVVGGKTQLIRRARGYAPLPVPVPGAAKHPSVLACGAQQKSAAVLTSGALCYPSAEMGALDNTWSAQVYRETIRDLQALLHIRPVYAVCDLHPGYESSRYAHETGLPVVEVQHHAAHIASVMAEHGLQERVIGVAFDGTGYGTDGTVWGGEFLLASPGGFERAGHLKAIKLLGGDPSIRQGWKTAACMLMDAGIEGGTDEADRLLRAALQHNVNTMYSSSAGRVFDAVSAMLGICREADYEGQCAIELENAAADCPEETRQGAAPFPYDISDNDGLIADLAPCFRAIWDEKTAGADIRLTAYRFHLTVCHLIYDMCARLREKYGIGTVALSGGVFQNRVLTEQTVPMLEKAGFNVYLNEKVPPNDGGIALGQAYAAWHMIHEGFPRNGDY